MPKRVRPYGSAEDAESAEVRVRPLQERQIDFFGIADTKGCWYLDTSFAYDLGGGIGVNAHVGYTHFASDLRDVKDAGGAGIGVKCASLLPCCSRIASPGSLSGRSPLKEGARRVPLRVHSRNSTEATSRGSTKIVPFGGAGAGGGVGWR